MCKQNYLPRRKYNAFNKTVSRICKLQDIVDALKTAAQPFVNRRKAEMKRKSHCRLVKKYFDIKYISLLGEVLLSVK